jgi:hemolysin activation/secretion protein
VVKKFSAAMIAAAFAASVSDHAAAQVPPAATRDLGSPEEQFRVKPPAGLQLDTPEPTAPGFPTESIPVNRFRFSGSTVVPESELESVVTPWTGRRVSPDELRAALAAVTAHLRERGLFAAQALLPSQNIADGEIRIDIVEGRVGKVDIEQPAGSRLRPSVVRGHLSSLQPETPIARGHLDTPLLLLNDLPGVRVEPSLTPGAVPGTADLDVKVSDERLLGGFVRIDNSQIRELGEVELTGQVRLRNPLGIGDLVTLEGVRSHTGGRVRGVASYSAPIGYSGTRIGAQLTRQRYRVGGDFELLRANGDFTRYSLFAVHPIFRMDDRNLAAFVSLNDAEYNDRIDAVALAAQSRHRYVTARLHGDRSDALLGGGQTAFYVEYQGGSVRLEPPSVASADALTLGTAGHFTRARFALERMQSVTARSALFGSWVAQLASKNLAAGREIQLTGPDGVRAYPSGELLADVGYLGKLEYRYRVTDGAWRTTAALFVDAAHGRVNKTPLSTATSNSRDRWGYGVALSAYHNVGFDAQIAFAWRGSGAPLTDPGRNPRIWFVATQYF